MGPEAAAAKIKARPAGVILAVAAGLDAWADQRRAARPGDKDAWMRLVAAARAADPDPRRDQLRQIWSEPDRKSQREPLRKLAQQADPRSWPVQSLVCLASALAEAGERDAAVFLLRRASVQHPGDFSINYDLARNLEQLRPPPTEEVIRYYTAARSIRPELGHNLAHALEKKEGSDEAITEFQELTRLRPGDALDLMCLGRALQAAGRTRDADVALDSAIAAFREQLRQRPGEVQTRARLGHTFFYHGKLDEAIAEYRECIRLQPDDTSTLVSWGILLCDHKHEYEAAVAKFREAIRLQADNAHTHDCLGVALEKQGKWDEAIAAFREAIRLEPDNARSRDNIGKILRSQGKMAEAIAQYHEAMRFQPDSARLRNGLAWTLVLGRPPAI